MQLNELTTAKLAQIKAFCRANNIEILGDLRHKQTWIDAAQAFLTATAEQVKESAIALRQEAITLAQETVEGAIECVREVVTYDNAVIVANATNAWTRKALKFLAMTVWNTFLVSIALAMLAIDAYRDRQRVKADLLAYCKVRLNIKTSVKSLSERFRWFVWYKYLFLRFHGDMTLRSNVVTPILNHRDRIRSMARAAAK